MPQSVCTVEIQYSADKQKEALEKQEVILGEFPYINHRTMELPGNEKDILKVILSFENNYSK